MEQEPQLESQQLPPPESQQPSQPEPPLTPPANLSIPGAFGRFRLLRSIGEGGMGKVVLAEMQGVGGFTKKVALKLVHPRLAALDPTFTRSFIGEARLGGHLEHHNIVQTLDFGEQDGHLYLAMEYVDGLTLSDLLQRFRQRAQAIPTAIALQIMSQVCQGLHYAHRATDSDGGPLLMVHRDLKPANILLSTHGLAKIADFGVARATSNLDQTQLSGSLRGTVRYMSPEQAWGQRNLDSRSDLFTTGLILFELLTTMPLNAGRTFEVQLRLAQDARFQERLEMIPKGPLRNTLIQFLRRTLAPRPDDRFQIGGEQAARLDEMLEQLPRMNLSGWLESVVQTGKGPPAVERGHGQSPTRDAGAHAQAGLGGERGNSGEPGGRAGRLPGEGVGAKVDGLDGGKVDGRRHGLGDGMAAMGQDGAEEPQHSIGSALSLASCQYESPVGIYGPPGSALETMAPPFSDPVGPQPGAPVVPVLPDQAFTTPAAAVAAFGEDLPAGAPAVPAWKTPRVQRPGIDVAAEASPRPPLPPSDALEAPPGPHQGPSGSAEAEPRPRPAHSAERASNRKQSGLPRAHSGMARPVPERRTAPAIWEPRTIAVFLTLSVGTFAALVSWNGTKTADRNERPVQVMTPASARERSVGSPLEPPVAGVPKQPAASPDDRRPVPAVTASTSVDGKASTIDPLRGASPGVDDRTTAKGPPTVIASAPGAPIPARPTRQEEPAKSANAAPPGARTDVKATSSRTAVVGTPTTGALAGDRLPQPGNSPTTAAPKTAAAAATSPGPAAQSENAALPTSIRLVINSRPQSDVTLDGAPVSGCCPIDNLKLAVGTHQLIFSRTGEKPLSTRIEAAAGQVLRCAAYFDSREVKCRSTVE